MDHKFSDYSIEIDAPKSLANELEVENETWEVSPIFDEPEETPNLHHESQDVFYVCTKCEQIHYFRDKEQLDQHLREKEFLPKIDFIVYQDEEAERLRNHSPPQDPNPSAILAEDSIQRRAKIVEEIRSCPLPSSYSTIPQSKKICELCPFKTNRYDRYIFHLSDCHNIFICLACEFKASSASQKLAHIQENHTVNGEYVCNKCSWRSEEQLPWIQHLIADHVLKHIHLRKSSTYKPVPAPPEYVAAYFENQKKTENRKKRKGKNKEPRKMKPQVVIPEIKRILYVNRPPRGVYEKCLRINSSL